VQLISDSPPRKRAQHRLAMGLCCVLFTGLNVCTLNAWPQSSSCPADLNKRFAQEVSTALPYEKDTLGKHWAARPKYFLVIGVTKISTAGSKDEDFAKVDVTNVASALCDLGYAPVPGAPDGAQLSGSHATRDNLITAFEHTQQIASNDPLLILYFSGHGIPGSTADDLYLPLFEAKSLTINQSQSLKDLLTKLRTDYQGDLVVVLDACFSGTATVGRLLTSVDDFKKTAILTSSSLDEFSYPITVNSVKESAFTHYFLQALQSSGDVHDGLTYLSDVHAAVSLKLHNLFADPLTPPEEKLRGPMTPGISEVGGSKMVAYSRDHIENPSSNRRFLEQLKEEVISAFSLNTPDIGHLPSEIMVFSGRTLVATYDVLVSSVGIRTLAPTQIASDGTVIDPNKILALGFKGGGDMSPSSLGGGPVEKSLKIDGLFAGGDQHLTLDHATLNHVLAVPIN
jgi:hypothetical protein